MILWQEGAATMTTWRATEWRIIAGLRRRCRARRGRQALRTLAQLVEWAAGRQRWAHSHLTLLSGLPAALPRAPLPRFQWAPRDSSGPPELPTVVYAYVLGPGPRPGCPEPTGRDRRHVII